MRGFTRKLAIGRIAPEPGRFAFVPVRWIALVLAILVVGCGPTEPAGDAPAAAGEQADQSIADRQARGGGNRAVTDPAADAPPSRLLFDYVARDDSTYEWHEHARFERAGAELVELRLVSQTWRGTTWKHQLVLIRPQNVADPERALLIIGGGRWSAALDGESQTGDLPDGAGIFIGLAQAAGSVVAVLGTVPFQPLLGLTEDRLIAHTFDRFLAEGDPDWPLLFPMVKASVRAMDASQEAADAMWDLSIESFTVMGGSKRGWTAWLTAAADPRVSAVAPIVIDALNMAEHFPYQTKVWGAPSSQIRPYTDLGLDEALASERGRALREAVDPYAYRSVLTMPKLIVNASNDAYFPLDAVNLYWAGLPEPKRLLEVANQGHSIDDYGRVLPAIIALHRAQSQGTELPAVTWEHALGDAEYRLCVAAVPAPERIIVREAESDDRDFRDATWQTVAGSAASARFVWERARPDAGYAAVFAELQFRGELPYSLTTTPAVIPARGQTPLEPGMVSQGEACPDEG